MSGPSIREMTRRTFPPTERVGYVRYRQIPESSLSEMDRQVLSVHEKIEAGAPLEGMREWGIAARYFPKWVETHKVLEQLETTGKLPSMREWGVLSRYAPEVAHQYQEYERDLRRREEIYQRKVRLWNQSIEQVESRMVAGETLTQQDIRGVMEYGPGMRLIGWVARKHPRFLDPGYLTPFERGRKATFEMAEEKVELGQQFTEREIQRMFHFGGMRLIGQLTTYAPHLVSKEFRQQQLEAEAQQLKLTEAHEARLLTSKQFYEDIGYPKLGGKYDPFKIPEGYTIAGIVAKQDKLKVRFEEPKGIAENLMKWWSGVDFKGLIQIPRFGAKPEILQMMKAMKVGEYRLEPIPVLAGTIASFERPTYIVGRLLGFKTPRPPPTFTGGTLGTFFWSLPKTPRALPLKFGQYRAMGLRGRQELLQVEQYGPGYATGTLFGDIYASVLAGTVLEKAGGAIVKAGRIIKPHVASGLKRAGGWTAKQILGPERYFYYRYVSPPSFPSLSLPEVFLKPKMAYQLGTGKFRYQLSQLEKLGWPHLQTPSPLLQPKIAHQLVMGKLRYQLGQLPSLSWPRLTTPSLLIPSKIAYQLGTGKLRYQLGQLPSLSWPRFALPEWLLKAKIARKLAMGRLRYKLGIPAPPSYTPSTWGPFRAPEQFTLPAEVISVPSPGTITKQLSRLAPPISSDAWAVALVAPLVVAPPRKKEKRRKISMVEWPGEPYPQLPKMKEWERLGLPKYPVEKYRDPFPIDKGMLKESMKQIRKSQQLPSLKTGLDALSRLDPRGALSLDLRGFQRQDQFQRQEYARMQKQIQETTRRWREQEEALSRPRRRRKRGKRREWPFGAYRVEYPITSPKKVMEMILGK